MDAFFDGEANICIVTSAPQQKLIEKHLDMKCVLLTNRSFISSQPSRDHLSIEVKVPTRIILSWLQVVQRWGDPAYACSDRRLRNFVEHTWA